MKITRLGKDFATLTAVPEVGDQFPEFTVKNSNSQTVQLSDLLTKTLLISVVPDINTSVCSLQTKKFNEEVDQYGDINFVTISTNTLANSLSGVQPKMLKKCSCYQIRNKTLVKQLIY